MQAFKVGDKVAYSSKWLKSTMAHELAPMRGVVHSVEQMGKVYLVAVQWRDGTFNRALNTNLVMDSRRHLEAF